MMQVDLNDPNSVLWLQQALMRVLPGRVHLNPTGQYEVETRKMVRVYQQQNNLPQTGEPDAVTVQKIAQDLAQLDRSPFKKKQ